MSFNAFSGRIDSFLLAGLGASQISEPSAGLRPLRFGFAGTSFSEILQRPGIVNCPDPPFFSCPWISSNKLSKTDATSFFDISVFSAMFEMICVFVRALGATFAIYITFLKCCLLLRRLNGINTATPLIPPLMMIKAFRNGGATRLLRKFTGFSGISA
jgi:hypothetical protein